MSIISPNMGLSISTIGTDSGLQWEQNLNSSLLVLDGHNHSAGNGVPIQPNGININDDLTFGGNNATALRAARFTAQVTPIPNSGVDIGEIYVSGNELYYNDVTGGHQIQITSGGSVNAGAGSITGLPSGTASATFSAGTFVWQSATSTAANMDFGSAILRNSGAGSFGLTLQAPTLAANTSQTLPQTPSSVTSIMQMDTSGNMSAALTVDNSTVAISANVLGVKAGGITTTQISNSAGITGTQIANATIATANLVDGSVTKVKQGAAGQQISSSSGVASVTSSSYTNFTNLSVTITTTGRPVMVFLQSDASAGGAQITFTSSDTFIQIVRGSTPVVVYNNPGTSSNACPVTVITGLDTPTAGTYTYKVQGKSTTAQIFSISRAVLVAYEI